MVIVKRVSVGLQLLARNQTLLQGDPSDGNAGRLVAVFAVTDEPAVDIRSLYHWCYAVEDFLCHRKSTVDRSELERLSIFRHKILVHHGQTPLVKRGAVAAGGRMWGPDDDTFRIISHPIFR